MICPSSLLLPDWGKVNVFPAQSMKGPFRCSHGKPRMIWYRPPRCVTSSVSRSLLSGATIKHSIYASIGPPWFSVPSAFRTGIGSSNSMVSMSFFSTNARSTKSLLAPESTSARTSNLVPVFNVSIQSLNSSAFVPVRNAPMQRGIFGENGEHALSLADPSRNPFSPSQNPASSTLPPKSSFSRHPNSSLPIPRLERLHLQSRSLSRAKCVCTQSLSDGRLSDSPLVIRGKYMNP